MPNVRVTVVNVEIVKPALHSTFFEETLVLINNLLVDLMQKKLQKQSKIFEFICCKKMVDKELCVLLL